LTAISTVETPERASRLIRGRRLSGLISPANHMGSPAKPGWTNARMADYIV